MSELWSVSRGKKWMVYLGQITRHNNEANYLDPKSRSLELFLGFSVWDPKWRCCHGLPEFLPCVRRED